MEKQTKITTGKSLGALIGEVIKESMRAALYKNGIAEKEKQSTLSKLDEKDEEDLFGAGGEGKKPEEDVDDEDEKDAPEPDDAEDAPEAEPADGGDHSPAVAGEMEKLKNADVSAKDVVDKLNVIRAGKSFKDSSISGPLEQYVDSLKPAEKVALMAFLKGISQIITGEISADQAVKPDAPEPDVEMKKGGDTKKVTVKPNVVKNPSKGTKRPSGEDTKGPTSTTPITPKAKK